MPKLNLAFIGNADIFPTTEMSDETRVCKTCETEKPITSFYKQGGRNNPLNRQWSCSKCSNKKTVERRNSSPQQAAHHKEILSRWKKANEELVKKYNRKSRGARKAWKKKNKRLLEDSYVAKRLGLRVAEAPVPLLKAMRSVLKSNRILWKLQQTTPIQNASETK